MKEFFKRKKDGDTQAESSEPKLGGVFFGFSEQGQKHAVSMADMPEDVKAYLEELGRQTCEENGGGVVTLSSDNMPDYVAEYMREQTNRFLKGMDEDEIGEARLIDFPREVVQASFFDMIDASFERYAREYPECRDDIRPSVGTLKVIAKILLNTDEDWQGLKVNDAGRLFGGICMAMMEACVMAHNLNKVGWEDRKDEKNT